MDLDGVYIPSFNNDLKHLNYPKKKNFLVLGSAHNIKEIRIKEMQKVDSIFFSSLFNKKKNFLGINKFLNLISFTKKRIIALGGINKKNLNKLRLLNINGYAGINFFTIKRLEIICKLLTDDFPLLHPHYSQKLKTGQPSASTCF